MENITITQNIEFQVPSEAIKAKKKAPPSFGDSRTIAEASSYVLDIINADQLSPERCDVVMRETLSHWAEHINPAFLQYRKSVAAADGFAAIEWKDGAPGGSTVLDALGNEFIDCLGGFGIYNVGHSNPNVLAAVRKQMEKQSLHSQELLDPLRAYCAAVLSKTLPGDGRLKYAFFTNSGAESVEHCLKFAMLSTGGRKHYVGILGAFHGKTMGALSATSKSVFRKAFGPGLLSFSHVPVNDCEALRRIFEASRFTGNEIAGFIVEPVLGEGGIHICTDEYLKLARSLCDEYGARLIFDEVQSGMGRTGQWWACQHSGVVPDLVAIGKAFGGGVTAAGAVVGTKEVWEKYFDNPFLFTTTFGGNPVAMAAAIATIHEIESKGLIKAAADKGEYLRMQLEGLRSRFPHIIKEVRGKGLMLGLEFPSDDIGYAFSRGVFARRVLLSGTLVNSRVLRVEPPLTITQEEMDTVLERFRSTLEEMHSSGLGVPVHQHEASEVPVGKVSAPSGAAADTPVKISAPFPHPSAASSAADLRRRADSELSAASSDTEPSHGTSSVQSGESSSLAEIEDDEDFDEAELAGTEEGVKGADGIVRYSDASDQEDPRHVKITRKVKLNVAHAATQAPSSS